MADAGRATDTSERADPSGRAAAHRGEGTMPSQALSDVVVPAMLGLEMAADPRLDGRGAESGRIDLLRYLQRTHGNQAVGRYLQRARAAPSLVVQRRVLDPAAPTIAYPAGLLQACPSLARSGRLELSAGSALRDLAASFTAREKAKAAFDAARDAFHARAFPGGKNLAAAPSKEELDKIKGATAVADPEKDPAGLAARNATLRVDEMLSTYRNHLNDVKTLTDQISKVDDGAIKNAKLKLDTEKKKAEEKQKQKDLQDLQSQSSLANIIGGVLSQIGQGIAGEALKLLTARTVEKLDATKNAENAKDPKNAPMQGTLLAMGLEDLAGGVGGVAFLVTSAATDLINRITGVKAKQDALQEQIGKLQDAIQQQSVQAAKNELGLAVAQQEIHAQDLKNKKQAFDDDARHLQEEMAQLNKSVDKKAGVSTFEDSAAALAAGDAELKAADDYKNACIDLVMKGGAAAAAVGTSPTGLPPVSLSPSSDGDGGASADAVASEIRALMAAQNKEQSDTDSEKTNVQSLEQLIRNRIGQAFAAANAGAAANTAPAPTP